MTGRVGYWRWRFLSWRWHHAPFRLTATVVWPDEKPMLPTSRVVVTHSYHYCFWTPWAMWKAANEWEDPSPPQQEDK